jgi:orotate phosphoribosyltransferase
VLTSVDALKEADTIVVGVAVIVERGAKEKVELAGLKYLVAYQLSDPGL